MNNRPCQWLDDYLAHDLTGAERSDFVAHLDQCAECRAAVGAAELLANRLRSAAERYDPVPPNIAVSISGRVRARLWRRRALAALGLAASIGFVAIWLGREGVAPEVAPIPSGPPIASA